MARLEELTQGAAVRGVIPDGIVTVVSARWYGGQAVDLTYKDSSGRPGSQLLYRHQESELTTVEVNCPWSFGGDGELFRCPSTLHRYVRHSRSYYERVFDHIVRDLAPGVAEVEGAR